MPLAAGLAAAAAWRPPPDPDTLATCAQFEFRCGLVDAAAEKAAAALEREPDHPLALLVEGGCLERRGDLAGACDRYARALPGVEPGEPRVAVFLALASLETDRGRRDEAAAWLDQAEEAPAGPRAKRLYARARWAARFERADEAARLFAETAAAAGDDAPALVVVGRELVALGRPTEALAALARAGDFPPALYAAARLKFEAGEVENGRADLERLQARNRSWLRRQMEKDSEVWIPIDERGDLPAGFLRAGEDGRGPR